MGAQQSATPARFVADDWARPLDAATFADPQGTVTARWSEIKRHHVAYQPNAWRLRWRTPQTSEFAVHQAKADADPVAQRQLLASSGAVRPAGLNWRDASSPVEAAVQLETVDPFEDPFGDRAQPDEPSAEPAPGPTEELPPAPPARLFQQAPPARIEDCDRIYKDRNCCEEEQECEQAREYVRTNSIRDISLDITPEFTIAQLDTDEDLEYREQLRFELAEAPSRDWRNREGEVVASGRFSDFRNGRVIITDADGQTARVPFKELSDDDVCFVTAWWSIPTECTFGDGQGPPREWLASTMTWKASAVCHKPLYFEEVQLERYGHSAGPLVQPALSGAHFFLNIAALPYKMGINPPNECRYPLGYYRPGNCAPWLVPPIPLSIRGGLLAAGAYTGGVYVIP